MDPSRRVAVILGTRPEAIKLAPVIRALRSRGVATLVVTTGQHRDLVNPVLRIFDLVPDLDLRLMRHGATLDQILGRAIIRVGDALRELTPTALMVQGDTTSALGAALAAFHGRVPVAHVEAGLRSRDMSLPFPEEMNRRAISLVATWHFAPTASAARNLREESSGRHVTVTGNTVVDALRFLEVRLLDRPIPSIPRPYILATAHRRESWGEPIRQIALALRDVLESWPDMSLVFVTHPNPAARDPVSAVLAGVDRARVLDAADYLEFVSLLKGAILAVSDSGGVQEEGPTLGIPVLVTREVTERPEGVEAGAVRIVGTKRRGIRDEVTRLLEDGAARNVMATSGRTVYGDGSAGERIADVMVKELAARP